MNYNGHNPNCEPLLKQWKKNKRDLYKLFQNNLILKYPIEVPEDYQEEYLKEMFYGKTGISEYHEIIAQIDGKSIAKNILQKELTINGQTFPKNMKLSRVFRKLMSDIRFAIFDNIYGNILKNNFKKGNLCFSIHPLDYLTMGDNSAKWTSCHALAGEFKGGLLSLLIDECTVVCYIEIDGHRFNYRKVMETSDKIWRMLIHIHPEHNLAMFNKGYPSEHKYAYKEVVNKLCDIMKLDNITYTIPPHPDSNVEGVMVDYEPEFDDDPLHYNDLLIGDKFERPSISLISKPEFIKDNKFTNKALRNGVMIVGSPVICPICGDGMVEHHKSLECACCDPLEFCCTCATKYHEEELHVIDDELYCDDCFDSEFIHCEQCQELIRRTWEYNGSHICEEDRRLIYG